MYDFHSAEIAVWADRPTPFAASLSSFAPHRCLKLVAKMLPRVEVCEICVCSHFHDSVVLDSVWRTDLIFSYAAARLGVNITSAVYSELDRALKTTGNSPGLNSDSSALA